MFVVEFGLRIILIRTQEKLHTLCSVEQHVVLDVVSFLLFQNGNFPFRKWKNFRRDFIEATWHNETVRMKEWLLFPSLASFLLDYVARQLRQSMDNPIHGFQHYNQVILVQWLGNQLKWHDKTSPRYSTWLTQGAQESRITQCKYDLEIFIFIIREQVLIFNFHYLQFENIVFVLSRGNFFKF